MHGFLLKSVKIKCDCDKNISGCLKTHSFIFFRQMDYYQKKAQLTAVRCHCHCHHHYHCHCHCHCYRHCHCPVLPTWFVLLRASAHGTNCTPNEFIDSCFSYHSDQIAFRYDSHAPLLRPFQVSRSSAGAHWNLSSHSMPEWNLQRRRKPFVVFFVRHGSCISLLKSTWTMSIHLLGYSVSSVILMRGNHPS